MTDTNRMSARSQVYKGSEHVNRQHVFLLFSVFVLFFFFFLNVLCFSFVFPYFSVFHLFLVRFLFSVVRAHVKTGKIFFVKLTCFICEKKDFGASVDREWGMAHLRVTPLSCFSFLVFFICSFKYVSLLAAVSEFNF